MRISIPRAFLVTLAFCGLTSCQKVRAAPFPQVDRGKLLISLTRSACFGTCPDYKVVIDGRGHVVFSTDEPPLAGGADAHREFSNSSHVVAPGHHEDDVGTQAVGELLKKFRDLNFFTLKNEYAAQVTDNPTYVLEIDTGHGRKRLVDYVGRDAGMPASVGELENAVDQLTGSGRWVDGKRGLAESLQKEGFDFRSDEAARMLLAAIEEGDDDTLIQFVRRGAPLAKNVGTISFGSAAVLAAIENGRTPLFKILVNQGWLKRTESDEVETSFASSAGGCNPELVDAAVAAGVRVDAITSPVYDKRMGHNGAKTAIRSLADSYRCDEPRKRLLVAGRLLANGANPNKRDSDGATAIFGVEDVALLNLLLAQGADPKVVDKAGNSAVFGSWTDEIVLRLLQAGASPKGHYYDGKALLEQMRERPMPKVRAWLDAHPTVLAEAKSS
jgi:hypothetical protein